MEEKRVLFEKHIEEYSSKGFELVSSSNLGYGIWFFWKKFGKGKVWSGAHLTFFNVELLEGLFKKAGLKIEEKKMFNWGMGVCYRLGF